MANWKLPFDLQGIEEQLAALPLPEPPARLRQAVLEDPRARKLFASRAQQLPASRTRLAALFATLRAVPTPVVSSAAVRSASVNRRSHMPSHYAYLRSGVIVCLVTLMAWYLSSMNYPRVGQTSLTATGVGGTLESEAVMVGRVTGSVECVWAEDAPQSPSRDYVTMGQQIRLASGLLEITYNSGSKIILLGPAAYDVSSDGGYLSAGRLVAKLQPGPAWDRGLAVAESDATDQAATDNWSALKLTIRTPSIGLFNVGGEVGVKVDDRDSSTVVHVFQGTAALCSPLDTGKRPWHVLEKKQSVRFDMAAADQEPARQSVVVTPGEFSYRVGSHRRPADKLNRKLDFSVHSRGL